MTGDYAIAQTLATGSHDWLRALIAPEEWTQDALCAQTDPEMFHPEKGGSTKDAKTICGRCDVILECRAYALRNNEQEGIWGGLSAPERRKIRRAARA